MLMLLRLFVAPILITINKIDTNFLKRLFDLRLALFESINIFRILIDNGILLTCSLAPHRILVTVSEIEVQVFGNIRIKIPRTWRN